MRIETERLVLRAFCKDDLQDLHEYLSDAKVVQYEPHQPMTLQETEETLNWRISTDEMIAVELKETGKLIGNVYLGKREFASLELGYVFHQRFWGHGYAKEACEVLLRKAFSEGTHRIYAECDPDNAASWKLLERLGFQREAHLRQNVYFWQDEQGNPIWKDTFIYAILEESPCAS